MGCVQCFAWRCCGSAEVAVLDLDVCVRERVRRRTCCLVPVVTVVHRLRVFDHRSRAR